MVVVDHVWQDGDELILQMDWEPTTHLAADNSIAISYGPLLYSLRIPERAEHYKSYPIEGFHDTNNTPIEAFRWDYTFQLDRDSQPGKFITPSAQPVQAGKY